MDAEQRSELLATWAAEEGFDRSGVARLAAVENGAIFIDWLSEGSHAGMGYLARRAEVRLDPRLVFDGARSALCVALQYAGQSAGSEPETDLWSGVARYARGSDYHQLMDGMLERLAARIEESFPGTRTRSYVDTGPVLERHLAAEAGLGVVGKNTCLLHPDAGSWFFIGEIFTSLELEPAAPFADLCGSCTRCLDACPTDALSEPYRLEADLCISYWTIEHRGTIPLDVRPLLDGWVFGCDICQEVCPANDVVGTAVRPEFELRPNVASMDLSDILSLSIEEYREVFRGSPMKRTKFAGLARNAVVAMGNSRSVEYVEPLAQALSSEVQVIRRHAAWALGRIGGGTAASFLGKASETEENPLVRSEILRALADVESSS